MQEDVGVGVDEAGQDGRAGEVDDRGAGRHARRRRVAYGLDPPAAHDDHLIVPCLVGSAVEQRAVADHGDDVGARTFRPVGRGEEGNDEQIEEGRSHAYLLDAVRAPGRESTKMMPS